MKNKITPLKGKEKKKVIASLCPLPEGNNHGTNKERKTHCLTRETLHICRKTPWSWKPGDDSRP